MLRQLLPNLSAQIYAVSVTDQAGYCGINKCNTTQPFN